MQGRIAVVAALLTLLALFVAAAGVAQARPAQHRRHHPRHRVHATRRHKAHPHRRAHRRPRHPSAGAGATSSATAPAALPAVCPDTDLIPAPGNLDRIAAATLCLINKQRESAGLHLLADNAKLDRVALAHSQDMTSRSYFDHNSPTGSTPVSRMTQAGYISNQVAYTIGENIAWGTLTLASPASIVNAWMNSPEHRANILDPAFRDSGIGVSPSAPVPSLAAGEPGATYTQNFGVVSA